jgi:prolyl oligopeptidase
VGYTVPFRYPPSRASDVVDSLHGVRIADPYRWLEDPDSEETRAWVDAQNALTRSMLDGPERDAFVRELTGLFDYARTTAPQRRGDRYFFTHNPGLLNQPILYMQDAVPAPGTTQPEARVVIDANLLSADGTTALTAAVPSSDGTRIAWALSQHGSDRQQIRVLAITGSGDATEVRELDDRLDWVKFASIAWTRDGSGFYYLRFPEPGSVPPEDEQYFGRIYFHRLGQPQASDDLVFARPDEKEIVPLVQVATGGRWVVITAQRGASDDSEVYLVDRASNGPPRPLFTGFDAAYHFIEEAGASTGLATGTRLLFRTTRGAPRGRIVAVDAEDPAATLREIVPETEHRLSAAVTTRNAIVAVYLQNASDRILTFDFSGTATGEIPLPGIGSLLSIDAEPDGDEVLFAYTSFTQPPNAWTFRLTASAKATASPPKRSARRRKAEATGTERSAPVPRPSRGFRLPSPEQRRGPVEETASGGFRLQAEHLYVTEQVWYASKDGTRVSMFLVRRRDLPRDGERPVLLSGYGGFNISRTPAFDPGNFPFLDRGGIFALANLRGGGEYGEDWHAAGMLERKQNVFDDFIAAAEFLIAEGCTVPRRIAIEGGSNGGLLVGAAMIQRPDLFGAVLCRVPVADMLRYHLFTVGRFWIPEYGSADDPAQFEYLLKYSPYHNVKEGVRYPPTLVMTADTDDRVSPGMAKKFAARLQASGAGGPILIRVETRAGHGAGKPVAKVIDEEADMLTFLTRWGLGAGG